VNVRLQKCFFYPLAQWYLKETTLELVETLKKFDYMNREDIDSYTMDKLRKLVRHAYDTTVYYKTLFDSHGLHPSDIRTISDFSAIPLLTKDQLRDNFNALLSTSKFPKVSKVHSGGTMGQSIYVMKDNYALSFDRAVKGKCIDWYNCSIGDREFRFWAYPFNKLDNFRASIIDLFLNRKRVSPIHMKETTANKIINKINSFHPKIVYGWASGLYKFSQITREKGFYFNTSSIKLIISTAEKLYDYQRNVIEKTFSTPVVDEYGCSEAGVIAFQCPSGNNHIQIENNYIEVVNKDKYYNDLGELVITNLSNYKMPLIRYKIGDLGRIENSHCGCGRTTPVLMDVSGRILDYLIDSDGNTVLGEVFCYICFDLIDKYKAIRDFRVHQQSNGTIDIFYSPSLQFDHRFLPIFEKAIKKHVGSELKINFIEKIDLSKMDAGKPRYVVSAISRKHDKR
jgi:phenylacetate-CoA ligase